MTEWEKNKEKEDFFKRYQEQIKKLDSLKKENLKFVSTSILNEQNHETAKQVTESVSFPEPASEPIKELSDMERAAKESKFGKLTRTVYEWRPNPTLCKRFNLPNPFPDSKEFGTVLADYEKRKTTPKFSVFNAMTNETRFTKDKSSKNSFILYLLSILI